MTAWPTTEGLWFEATAVAVAAALTVWVMPGETADAEKLVLPRYLAVMVWLPVEP